MAEEAVSSVETPGSLGAQLPSCCTLGPARDPPRLATRSIASCPTRSHSHSCECIRGCSAPDHSHERSSRLDLQLALSPRTQLDSPTRSRECICGCSAPDHSHKCSRDPTCSSPYRLAPDPTRLLACTSVFAAAVHPITRTGVVVTRPTHSLGPSQEPTHDPPDHIVSNPCARTCASVAAVRPITRTGAVVT